MNHLAAFVLPILLLVWIVYRRIQRTIGFQRLARRRLVVRIWVLGIVGAIVVGLGVLHPIVYLGDLVGLAAGSLLAFAAVRFLKFEERDGQWYYRTHVWVEAVVLVLFLGRIAFRVIQSIQEGGQHRGFTQAQDPLTAGALMMFVCYYIVFAAVLLRRARKLEAPAGDPASRG